MLLCTGHFLSRTVNQNLIKVSVVCNDFKSLQQPISIFQFLLQLKIYRNKVFSAYILFSGYLNVDGKLFLSRTRLFSFLFQTHKMFRC